MGFEPKIKSQSFGGTSKAWIRTRKGLGNMKPIMLDMSSFDPGHVIDGKIPSGIALGAITAAPGYYGPYDSGAQDGRETFVGLLFEDCTVSHDPGVTPDVATAGDPAAALYWEGVVLESELPTFGQGVDGGVVDSGAKTDNPNIAYW